MHNRDEATSVLSLSGRYHKLYLLFAALVTFMILPYCSLPLGNLVPRACDPWEGNEGSGIIRFREESDWPLK